MQSNVLGHSSPISNPRAGSHCQHISSKTKWRLSSSYACFSRRSWTPISWTQSAIATRTKQRSVRRLSHLPSYGHASSAISSSYPGNIPIFWAEPATRCTKRASQRQTSRRASSVCRCRRAPAKPDPPWRSRSATRCATTSVGSSSPYRSSASPNKPRQRTVSYSALTTTSTPLYWSTTAAPVHKLPKATNTTLPTWARVSRLKTGMPRSS